jgi:biotin carboxyl carrier protein
MKKHYGRLMTECCADDPAALKTMSEVLDRKGTLLTRPLERLLDDPHLLSGWLSLNRKNHSIENGKVVWLRNPLVILEETYNYLNMNYREHEPAAEIIWDHDDALLKRALRFYADLREKFGLEKDNYFKLDEILKQDSAPQGFSEEEWQQVQASHFGFEAGNEILGILFLIAENTSFYDFRVEEDLEVTIPDYLTDPDLQARMKKVLAPPPATKDDEIVAMCGGMYYAQEAPGLPAFVSEGMHFEKGQPLYIIEVMKMFNTVRAQFSGTIDKILVEGGDGTIVKKGQPLFKVTPDEKFDEIDPKQIERERRTRTSEYLKGVL